MEQLFIDNNKYVQNYYKEAKQVIQENNIGEGVIVTLDKMFVLNTLFSKHRSAIENIIKYQKEKNLKQEKATESKIELLILIMVIVGIVILAANIIMSLYLGKKMVYYHNAINELMIEKDRFYSVISHDLRGPVGNISELLKSIDEFQEEDKLIIIEELKKISKKTLDLLNDLLDWSKVQQNRIEMQICSVEKIITETVELFNEIANQKKIIIKKEVEEFHIEINERVLKTVLRNLISNAIKYTKREGEIVIESVIVTGKQIGRAHV